MRLPWDKSKIEQLDLVEDATEALIDRLSDDGVAGGDNADIGATSAELSLDQLFAEGVPLLLPVERLEEDPANPRTEFPDAEIAELAQDIAMRGILQPIVVRRARATGRATGSSSARSACVRQSGPASSQSPSSSAQRPMTTSMRKSPRTRSATA